MRIYLAAAMTNAGRDLDAIRTIFACLKEDGHDVPTWHVADPLGREDDQAITDAELAHRDLEWVAGCDALVAEVSTPSHGVGVEVTAALAAGKPVLLAHRRGAPVSRLLLGMQRVEVLAYGGAADAREGVRRFLARLAPRPEAGRPAT
jgi:hypothetical protein